MKYYKLTESDCTTYSETEWGEGVSHEATGKGTTMCSDDVIHVYDHPLKAAMFNPIHANFTNPILWGCRVRKIVADDSLKVGVKQCTTLKRVPLPEITTNQRVKFGILCALKVYHSESFQAWAENWLNNTDRAAGVAAEAGAAARVAGAEAAARVAAGAAAGAAARAAGVVAEAEAAARAAWAAAEAAGVEILDFVELIKKAIRDENALMGGINHEKNPKADIL